MDCFHISGDHLFLDIRVIPGASKSSLGDIAEGRLKVRIAATPEDGKANEELRSFLAKNFKLSKKDVVIVSGAKSRKKTLRLPVSASQLWPWDPPKT